jgi:hypothetical protein
MMLLNVTQCVDAAHKIIATVAIVAGGTWAYLRYRLRREDVWNLELTTRTEVLPYGPGLAILAIRLSLKNIGKVAIVPGPGGCGVSVRKVPEGISPNSPVEWDGCEPVVENVDVLRYARGDKPYYGHHDYLIEPTCEYHELGTVVVPTGGLYLVEAMFWWKKDTDCITEYVVAHVPREA